MRSAAARGLPLAQGVRLLLDAGRPVVLRPRGSSMLPAIFPGDRVRVAAPARRLRRRDIVLVDDQEPDRPGPRLHRVVRVDQDRGTITTRGDALALSDPEVRIDQVVAVVTAIEPVWSARLRFAAGRLCRLVLGRLARDPSRNDE